MLVWSETDAGDATATLHRYRDRLAPAVTHHAAAAIGPAIPAAPLGLPAPRSLVPPGVIRHRKACLVVCMLNAIVESGSKREVWFFFGARNRCEHIQKPYLEKIAGEHENVRLHICYSKPDKEDRVGMEARALSADLIRVRLGHAGAARALLANFGAQAELDLASLGDGLPASAWRVAFDSEAPDAGGGGRISTILPSGLARISARAAVLLAADLPL